MKELINILMSGKICMPFYEVAIVLVIQAFCFLYHAYRVGLLFGFVFAFYLGWGFFQSSFGTEQVGYIIAYCLFGLIILLLACYQFFVNND